MCVVCVCGATSGPEIAHVHLPGWHQHHPHAHTHARVLSRPPGLTATLHLQQHSTARKAHSSCCLPQTPRFGVRFCGHKSADTCILTTPLYRFRISWFWLDKSTLGYRCRFRYLQRFQHLGPSAGFNTLAHSPVSATSTVSAQVLAGFSDFSCFGITQRLQRFRHRICRTRRAHTTVRSALYLRPQLPQGAYGSTVTDTHDCAALASHRAGMPLPTPLETASACAMPS